MEHAPQSVLFVGGPWDLHRAVVGRPVPRFEVPYFDGMFSPAGVNDTIPLYQTGAQKVHVRVAVYVLMSLPISALRAKEYIYYHYEDRS